MSRVMQYEVIGKRSRGTVNLGELERSVSVLAGGFAVLYGLSRVSLPAVIGLLAGSALVARGLTGPCALYDALGISTCRRPARNQAGKRRPTTTEVSLAATGETN